MSFTGGKPLWPTLLRRIFREAAKRAGYPGLIFHDLRRSAVRNMERAGVLRTVAMRISGHRSEAVYRRYAIVSTEDVAQALARTEAYVIEQSADKTRTIRRSGTRK
jgi:integrase